MQVQRQTNQQLLETIFATFFIAYQVTAPNRNPPPAKKIISSRANYIESRSFTL